MDIRDHPFYLSVISDVDGNRKGDAKIIIDSRNARTGSSKTTLGIRLAMLFAEEFDYELELEDFTLSYKEYLERYSKIHPGQEQVSILLLDEISGTGAADARRFMSKRNVNLARAWETQRVRRVITICTCPSYNFIDKKLRMLADYRLACYPRPLGSCAAYSVGNTFSTSDLRLRRIGGRIRWPKLEDDNEFYEHLNTQKDRLNASMLFDFDRMDEEEDKIEYTPKEIEKGVKVELVGKFLAKGMTQREISELLQVGKSTISDWKHTYNL